MVLEDDDEIDDIIGTPYFIAPEVLKGHTTRKCDIWSLGVIAYMCLSGTPPFNGKDQKDIITRVKCARPSFENARWKNISKNAKNFITALLNKNFKDRPNAADALHHPWMLEVIERQKENLKNNKLDAVQQALDNFANF